MAMKAFFELHTKKSPRISSTQAPVDMSVVIFKEPDVESQIIMVIDHNVAFGASSDEGKGDEYSPEKIKACNIPVYSDSHFVWGTPLYREDGS